MRKSLSDAQGAGQFALKVYDMMSPKYPKMDRDKIIRALGDLYAGSWFPYGDASETTYFMLINKSSQVVDEAVRCVNALGYETDED